MKAMVLAAGLGTRLLPLTNSRPKALAEVGDRTLLQITLERLRDWGVDAVIVNVHHFGDMVVDYLEANGDFGMRIEVSREETLLDTGGGLKKAAWFFLEDTTRIDEPFLLHNVDVVSTIDLGRMIEFHRAQEALATLAVFDRETSRHLLFDPSRKLCGWHSEGVGKSRIVRSVDQPEALAFSGIHVLSPRLLPMMTEEGVFSIIDAYLNLAAQGSRIVAFRADEYSWQDLGDVESLKAAGRLPPV